jgi:hypothetical protein
MSQTASGEPAIRRSARWADEAPAWISALGLAIYYVASMCRDLSLYDSGELALAAYQPGLGHPPGQPLHTLLGWIAARLCFGAPLWGINAVSALPAALCVVPAARIAAGLRGARRCSPLATFVMALFAVHADLWEPASRVEVYALATVLALWAVSLLVPSFVAGPSSRQLLAATTLRAGILLGLSASANPVIAAAAGAGVFPGLWSAARSQRAFGRVFGCALLGGVLGLAPYAYLPIVARRGDVMVWGGLTNAASYLRYLTLGDYARNQTLGLAGWIDHALQWLAWSVRQLLAPVLILGLAGFVRARFALPLGRALYPIIALLLMAEVAANVVFHLDVPDYDGYMATAYWLAAAGCGAFLADVLASRRMLAAAAIVLCTGGAWAVWPRPWSRTRSVDYVARHLAETVLNEAPLHAIVIAYADYFAGSMFYLQEAEHQRRDVVVLAYGLSGSSWHWRHLQALHPGLVQADLQTRGGRSTRVRRWLEQNADRPVLVERVEIAQALGLRACADGLYFATGDACDEQPVPDARMARLLRRELERVDDGSPGTAGALAEVSYELGVGLWRLGFGQSAHDVLLAGVPRAAWPSQLAAAGPLGHVPPWTAPEPPWQRQPALGDPARNVFMAGAIASGSGQGAAARLGLPEAQHALARPAPAPTP